MHVCGGGVCVFLTETRNFILTPLAIRSTCSHPAPILGLQACATRSGFEVLLLSVI